MTGILKHAQGAPIADFTALTDGNATAVLTGDKGGYIINEIQISNTSGGSVNISIDIYDGSNVLFELKSAVALADNGILKPDIDGIPLVAPRILRVTGASGVKVAVVYYESVYASDQDRGGSSFASMGQIGQNVGKGGVL